MVVSSFAVGPVALVAVASTKWSWIPTRWDQRSPRAKCQLAIRC